MTFPRSTSTFNEFQGRDLFAGPIVRVVCSSRVTFLEPVTKQLPVSLSGSVVNIPHPSVSCQDIFFSAPREKPGNGLTYLTSLKILQVTMAKL